MSQRRRDEERQIMQAAKGILIGLCVGLLFLAGIVIFYTVVGWLWLGVK